MSLRVLLVDDQPLIRVGFSAILTSQEDIEVVGEACDGQEALELAAALAPDVVCMDVQMPRLDGIEVTRRLLAAGSRAAVLVLTTFDTDEALFAALSAGASGFLLKSAGPEELIQAVRVLGRGDALLDPLVTRKVLARTAGASALAGETTPPSPAPAGDAAAPAPGSPARERDAATSSPGAPGAVAGTAARPGEDASRAGLTTRETEVLTAMARGLSNAEIARELVVGRATVKTHVSNVLQKTGARDRVHAVIWAFEHGHSGT
ncbi:MULTISPECIES: response regulator transcription factor [Kocuria]|uniref:Response regulator transcription factor n=1 Tax=Kocuria salsicia TaxID=664639 RepID=A0ABV3KBJ8_9MICC|nr:MULTISPECIES: response regulator transcription factor [Kocuria]